MYKRRTTHVMAVCGCAWSCCQAGVLQVLPCSRCVELDAWHSSVSITDLLAAACAQLRPSMVKFPSSSRTLGIVSWAQPHPAHLNRQLITLLKDRSIAPQVSAPCVAEG